MAVDIEVAAGEKIEEALTVIERANPHLSQRFRRFRASGARWYDAVPITCKNDGILTSAAVIFRRAVYTGSSPALFGGIGAVATIPEMRGRGFAASLLSECENFLASEGYELAVLFCSIVSYYERLGWKPVAGREVKLGASADLSRWDLRRVDLTSIPDEIRKMYETSGTGALVRDSGVWNEYAAWVREDEDLFWAAFYEGCLRGYARGRRVADAIETLEATCTPSHEEALSALLHKQLAISSVSKFARSRTTIMIKPLFPDRRSGRRMLTVDDFENGGPWGSRLWWPIDRF